MKTRNAADVDPCRTLTPDMLPNTVEVETGEQSLDFAQAKRIAEEQAKTKAPSAMLLAWFDRKTGQFSPDVICCGDEKPTWLVYAESRGADLSVSINHGEYVFVFVSGEEGK